MTWKICKYYGMKKEEVIQLNILDYLEYVDNVLELMYDEFIKTMAG